MSLPPDIQEDLDKVKRGKRDRLVAVLSRHLPVVEELALNGDQLVDALRIIELREPQLTFKAGSMRRAFNRRYGSWAAFRTSLEQRSDALKSVAEDEVSMAARDSSEGADVATDTTQNSIISDPARGPVHWGGN